MQPAQVSYPVRLFIRHKAKMKLSSALSRQHLGADIDLVLLQEITNTVLQPSVNPAIYQAYGSRELAIQVEESVSDAIASAYLRILQRRNHPDVERLNQLL